MFCVAYALLAQQYWIIFFPYSPRHETISVRSSFHNYRFASSHAILLRVTLGFLWKPSRPFVCFSSCLFSVVLCSWRSPCLLQPSLWTLYSNNFCSVAHKMCFGAGLSHSTRYRCSVLTRWRMSWGVKTLSRGTPLEGVCIFLNCNSTKQESVIFVIDEQLRYWCLFP